MNLNREVIVQYICFHLIFFFFKISMETQNLNFCIKSKTNHCLGSDVNYMSLKQNFFKNPFSLIYYSEKGSSYSAIEGSVHILPMGDLAIV